MKSYIADVSGNTYSDEAHKAFYSLQYKPEMNQIYNRRLIKEGVRGGKRTEEIYKEKGQRQILY